LLGDPLRVGRPVTAVGFSPDGSSLLALHDRITVWDSSLWRSDKNTLERVRRRFCALIDDESSQSRGSRCADRS
jgi:hypothetical protein